MSTNKRPLVSIVTPTLNAAHFLIATLQSVASQTYSEIEHIIVDGGSTDNTEEVVRSFPSSVQFISLPQASQSEAVNHGIARARGSLVLMLNGDDIIYANAVETLVEKAAKTPNAAVIYGEAYHIDAYDNVIELYPTKPFDKSSFGVGCFISQPAALVRRNAFLEIGGLDERLDYALDYDLWIRLAKRYPFTYISECVAATRMHIGTKTLGSRGEVYREVMATLRRHYGYVPYPWIFGYTSFLFRHEDQFFQRSKPTKLRVVASLLVGCYMNFRDVPRYVEDWFGYRKIAGYFRPKQRFVNR